MEQKLIYSMFVAAYVSDEITHRLREMNPHWPYDEQRMFLEYEKTFVRFILFSKKRYTGKKVEFNPYAYKIISMGVSDKRKDFCIYVKEIYRRILTVLYDIEREYTREELTERALGVLKLAIEDLLNNRVPFAKLKLSKLLNDEYALREKKEKKLASGTKRQKYTFGFKNIFPEDYIELTGSEATIAQVHSVDPKSWTPVCVMVEGTTEGVLDERRQIRFDQIARKFKGKIKLSKIVNPATTEDEIAGITYPHARLARILYARDPGTAPKSGDRVSFVYVQRGPHKSRKERKRKKELQWTKVEDPAYAKEKRMKTDNVYYAEKQMQKGWSQIIDAIKPGEADKLFEEAYYLIDKAGGNNVNIDHMFAGKRGRQEMKLGGDMGKEKLKPKPKRRKKKKKPSTKISTWFKPRNNNE